MAVVVGRWLVFGGGRYSSGLTVYRKRRNTMYMCCTTPKVHFKIVVKNWFRLVRGVAGRSLPLRLPVELRGGQEAHFRLGHAQHQQPQCQHPQEVLPRSSGWKIFVKIQTSLDKSIFHIIFFVQKAIRYAFCANCFHVLYYPYTTVLFCFTYIQHTKPLRSLTETVFSVKVATFSPILFT
jgi:hypothetical protein